MKRDEYSYRGISVIVEAKRFQGFETAASQAIAFMVGFQQNRVDTEPNLCSDTTYGVVSNGLDWRFLKLEGRLLTISEPLHSLTMEVRHEIYKFLDSIVKGAIDMSPQNSPARPQP